MEVDSDFASKFYSIQGDLIGERKRNLYKLFKETSLNPNKEEIDFALENLQPRNYLEQLFRVEALIYFHKTPQLVEILKEGNEIFVSKIIKTQWFLEEATNMICEDDLVNNFLPLLSYSLRMKVLKRLSACLPEPRMDKIFDSILKRYGLFIATHFLSSCSIGKIRNIIENNKEIKLWPNQLKSILEKDPELLIFCLENCDSTFINDGDKLYCYIAQNNPELFFVLLQRNYITPRQLGKRTSKKLLQIKKSDIGANVQLFVRIIKNYIFVRKLRDDFIKIYYDYFPKSLDRINDQTLSSQLLRYYPKKRQWNLFAETFVKKFNKDVCDNLVSLGNDFLKLFPDIQTKTKWAEEKYKKTENNIYIKYMLTEKSIPLLKEKLNLTSDIYSRQHLLGCLVFTCKENNDNDALEMVLKYFCFRHRNEDYGTRSHFLRQVECFDLKNLNGNHWKYIKEQLDLQRVQSEFKYWANKNLIKWYLVFLLRNTESVENEIKQFIEDVGWDSSFRIKCKEYPDTEKDLLIKVINLLPTLSSDDKDKRWNQLISDVTDFNIDNKGTSFISLLDFPSLTNTIKLVFSKTVDFSEEDCALIRTTLNYNMDFPEKAVIFDNDKLIGIFKTIYTESKHQSVLNSVLSRIICKEHRNRFEKKVLHLYFTYILSSKEVVVLEIIRYFCRNEPQVIAQYFDAILKNCFNSGQEVLNYYYIKKCSHLNLDERMIQFFKDKLEQQDFECRTQVMDMFSVLLKTEDYINTIEKYFLPKTNKLDLADKEQTKMYDLQCRAIKTIKNVNEPAKTLPIIMKFCVGDYLQSVLASLYSVFYRSPENNLHIYVDILSKRAVSVRKHALFLTCELLEQKIAVDMLKTIATKETNVSNKKHLFSTALKYFIKNPSNELFEVVVVNMNTVDKHDKETLESLVHSVIPRKYKVVYLEKCWEFYEYLAEKEEVIVRNYLYTLLRQFSDEVIITTLNLDFCRTLIKKYYLSDKDQLTNLDSFIIKFLFYREEKENIEFVFKIVRDYKDKYWNSGDKRECVYELFWEFYGNIRKFLNRTDFLLAFKTHWETTFNSLESFDKHILLKMLTLYKDTSEPFIENYAKAVALFLEQLINKFGPYILQVFSNVLKHKYDFTLKESWNRFTFLYHILKYKVTTTNCILAFELIENENPELEEEKSLLRNIVEILKNVQDPVVQIYYNNYISK